MAALGTALPHVGRSVAEGCPSKPSMANPAQLPWVAYGGDYGACLEAGNTLLTSSPSRETVERLCGTENFCELFNPKDLQEKDLQELKRKYGFSSHQECLAAHDSKPAQPKYYVQIVFSDQEAYDKVLPQLHE